MLDVLPVYLLYYEYTKRNLSELHSELLWHRIRFGDSDAVKERYFIDRESRYISQMFWTTLFITDAKSDAECSPLILPVTCISNKGSRRYQTSPMLCSPTTLCMADRSYRQRSEIFQKFGEVCSKWINISKIITIISYQVLVHGWQSPRKDQISLKWQTFAKLVCTVYLLSRLVNDVSACNMTAHCAAEFMFPVWNLLQPQFAVTCGSLIYTKDGAHVPWLPGRRLIGRPYVPADINPAR